MAGNGIETLDDTRRLQLLIDGVVDYALYLISPQGKVVSWNTGARRLKGYTANEIVGKPYATFFTYEDVRRGIPDAALSAATRDGRWEGEGWRVRKDGTRFWAMAVLDAVYDRGEVIGFAKITRDITQRLQTREKLNASETRLRQLLDAVVDYAIFQLDRDGYVLTLEYRRPAHQRIYRRRDHRPAFQSFLSGRRASGGNSRARSRPLRRTAGLKPKAGAFAKTERNFGHSLSSTPSGTKWAT
jgi:PAS domain S-box-containing protein